MLFDPKDQVMQQNLQYYRFYREQWGLEEGDFQPRPVSPVHLRHRSVPVDHFKVVPEFCWCPVVMPRSVPQEALAYFNVTTKQKEMLQFAQNYLRTDDEVCSWMCSAECGWSC